MKTILTILLLLAYNTFAQNLTVLGKIYIDTVNLYPTEYTTCDSTKTLRIMTDNELSNMASDRLSKMYKLSNDYDNEFLNGGFDFSKKVAVDSSKNILLIYVNVSNSYKLSAIDAIMDYVNEDDVLHKDIKELNPKMIYVNYFQVFNSVYKREHVVVTLVLPNNENKKYYYIDTIE